MTFYTSISVLLCAISWVLYLDWIRGKEVGAVLAGTMTAAALVAIGGML